ncbi:Type 2 DNA topoisomerase 6 subunit A [Candidatus Tiddalikarchaeum anstoanum]|nr:Type 2 DNA topoisomerase 6 subunit A [Candidatus Tiddalikarchaeum anstoanum]
MVKVKAVKKGSSRRAFIKALWDDQEIFGKENPLKPFHGDSYDPKIILVVEKQWAYMRIVDELESNNIKDITVISLQGFPSDKITTESIKETLKLSKRVRRVLEDKSKYPNNELHVSSRTKVYFIGDMDPISYASYYSLKKGNTKFKKAKDKIKVRYLGVTLSDTKKYNIPKEYFISLNKPEVKVLEYLINNKLVPELKKETSFMYSTGLKVEIEGLFLAIENKKISVLDYLKNKF